MKSVTISNSPLLACVLIASIAIRIILRHVNRLSMTDYHDLFMHTTVALRLLWLSSMAPDRLRDLLQLARPGWRRKAPGPQRQYADRSYPELVAEVIVKVTLFSCRGAL